MPIESYGLNLIDISLYKVSSAEWENAMTHNIQEKLRYTLNTGVVEQLSLLELEFLFVNIYLQKVHTNFPAENLSEENL